MSEQPQRFVPLREIVRRVDTAPPELRTLSRDELMECCLLCQAPTCAPTSERCVAQQKKAHPRVTVPIFDDETPIPAEARKRRAERRAWHMRQRSQSRSTEAKK